MSEGIEARLEALDASVLAALLQKWAGSDEDFRLWLATKLAALDARELRIPLDPEPFRHRAEALLQAARGGERGRHWDDSDSGIDEAALEVAPGVEPSHHLSFPVQRLRSGHVVIEF